VWLNAPVRFSVARAAILACVVSCAIATDAHAQFGVPFARYRTFETPHFILTFETGLEEYARRAASRIEAAHAELARAYGSTPRGKIRLVIVDKGDIFNGAATTVPTNRIVAFAHTPVEDDRFYSDDPLDLLVTHELAHVFHLDEARRGWRVLRGVFGRNELTFPHFFDGSYLIEGLATFYESRLTNGGRVRGSQFRETLRASVLETQGPRLDEAESDPGAWPLDRHYVLGSLFLDHLANRYGVNTTRGWRSGQAASDRFCRVGQVLASSLAGRDSRSCGTSGSPTNGTRQCACATGFGPAPRALPTQRDSVTRRTTPRFRASRLTVQ
jgi:hypothetical protein